MKRPFVLLAFALAVGFASAKPDEPPGAKGIPTANVKGPLPKLPEAGKAPASVQGGLRSHVHSQPKSGGSAAAGVLKFNPPKR